ncbi:MAG: DUF2214 family protein [Cyclobacteriaceae bacterium]|nr:DUF2214 family protein [Cyclobacteriaceae bacterium]
MYLEILVKYVHFISVFAIVSTIVAEHLLIKNKLSRGELSRLSRIDAVYGLSAITLLAAGFTLWFAVGKPASYYNHNWIFHLKIGLFGVIGLLSIYPTVFFLKQRKGRPEEQISLPKGVKLCIRLELLLLFVIPLLAVMMAKGIGYFGG